VTDFREATCRQYEENTCNRGGYCNFMHLKKISRYISSARVWLNQPAVILELGNVKFIVLEREVFSLSSLSFLVYCLYGWSNGSFQLPSKLFTV
jgi:hypothetical protein